VLSTYKNVPSLVNICYKTNVIIVRVVESIINHPTRVSDI